MDTFNKPNQNDPTTPHPNQAKTNDFFKPVHEMDPHIKRATVTYDFSCQLFRMSDDMDRDIYSALIKKCLNGELIQGRKEVNFKDGDMYIYLEWITEIKAPVVEGKPDNRTSQPVKAVAPPQPEEDAVEGAEEVDPDLVEVSYAQQPTLPFDFGSDEFTMKQSILESSGNPT